MTDLQSMLTQMANFLVQPQKALEIVVPLSFRWVCLNKGPYLLG